MTGLLSAAASAVHERLVKEDLDALKDCISVFEDWEKFTIPEMEGPMGREMSSKVYKSLRTVARLINDSFPRIKIETSRMITALTDIFIKCRVIVDAHPNFSALNLFVVLSLRCLSLFFQKTNAYYSKGGMDPQFHQQYIRQLLRILDDIICRPIRNDSKDSRNVGYGCIDLIDALGDHIVYALGIEHWGRFNLFLSAYTYFKSVEKLNAISRAKLVRCWGKFVAYRCWNDFSPMTSKVVGVACMGMASQEAHVQIASAWTFAQATDLIVAKYMKMPLIDTIFGLNFHTMLLLAGVKSVKVPAKGLLDALHGCANIFKWLPLPAFDSERRMCMIIHITKKLVAVAEENLDVQYSFMEVIPKTEFQMYEHGHPYFRLDLTEEFIPRFFRVRLSALRALCEAIDNENMFNQMGYSVTEPIIKGLTKWLAFDNDFKVKTECAVALRKIPSRLVFGSMFSLVVEHLMEALVRLPAENGEGTRTFKVEVLLCMFRMMAAMRMEDVYKVYRPLLRNYEVFSDTVAEVRNDVEPVQLDMLSLAGSNIRRLLHHPLLVPDGGVMGALLHLHEFVEIVSYGEHL